MQFLLIKNYTTIAAVPKAGNSMYTKGSIAFAVPGPTSYEEFCNTSDAAEKCFII